MGKGMAEGRGESEGSEERGGGRGEEEASTPRGVRGVRERAWLQPPLPHVCSPPCRPVVPFRVYGFSTYTLKPKIKYIAGLKPKTLQEETLTLKKPCRPVVPCGAP